MLRKLARRIDDPVARGLAQWLVGSATTAAASARIAEAFRRTGPTAYEAFYERKSLRFVRHGLEPATVEYHFATSSISVIPHRVEVSGSRVEVADAIADHGSAMLRAMRRERLDAWSRGCLLELFALPPRPWPSTPN